MSNNSKTLTRSLLLVLSFGMATASSAYAQTAEVGFDGSTVRTNLSNKLTMLSQQISAASCRAAAGFDADAAREELSLAHGEFVTILDGLENGSLALGIPTAEGHPRVRRSIAAVREIWEPVDAAARGLIEGKSDGIDAIATHDADLLNASSILASDILNQYSNPHEMMLSDAQSLSIAGRQRTISHTISKQACGLATGQEVFGSSDDLNASKELYATSLAALSNGMPAAGINPPPTDAISGYLETVENDWSKEIGHLEKLATGTSVSPDEVVAVAAATNDLTLKMSNVVTLYMLSAPRAESVYSVALESYAENQLSEWLSNPSLIAAIKEQNESHSAIVQSDIDAMDQKWRAEAKAGGGELITKTMSTPASEWLLSRQLETAGFVTEVFAMDNKGLNVAQSVETSDYWQGDEAKFQQSYGKDAMHFGDVEFDDSTGAYQTQVSLPIHDPADGNLIGAITFGINIQSLL